LDRLCWRNGFDISTNYYEEVPDTGIVREYWFSVENTTASPDGVEMPVQLINGSFPGPTIIADWGDTVGKCALFKFLKQKNLYINSSCTFHEFTARQWHWSSLPRDSPELDRWHGRCPKYYTMPYCSG
jgi:hypothetical protein